MAVRTLRLLVLMLTALGLAAAPASAGLADEVAAGRAVADRVDAGRAGCATLSDGQFEHLGEYVMDWTTGSRAAHAAMNARTARTVGAADAERMHESMGRRFAGCRGGDVSSVPFGPGMMGTRSVAHDRWGTAGVVLAVLALCGLVAVLVVILPGRPRPPGTPTAA